MKASVELVGVVEERLKALAAANGLPPGAAATLVLRSALLGKPLGLEVPWRGKGKKRQAAIDAAGQDYEAATANGSDGRQAKSPISPAAQASASEPPNTVT